MKIRSSVLNNLAFASVISILAACNTTDESVRQAVESQIKIYPASTLQDIYKSFFQDEFGPGHLTPDSASAAGYLDYELSEMTSDGNYMIVPCGEGKNFCRVPLGLVKDSIIPKEVFLKAFLESAKGFKIPDIDDWTKKWSQILEVIESMNLHLNHFPADKEFIAGMLKCGETTIHHSQEYSDAYDPHYRIMDIGVWKQLNSRFQIPDSKSK